MKKELFAGMITSMIWAGLAGSAQADLYTFYRITDNGNGDISSQLSVDVTKDSNRYYFLFVNTVGVASNVAEIYFDYDGLTSSNWSSAIDYMGSARTSGVNFADSPASPSNLPGGTDISFDSDYSRDIGSANDAGLNEASDWLKLGFSSLSIDLLAAMVTGDLRIGLHVRSIGTEGGSDAYVTGTTPVPEPATMLLFGAGLVGLAGVARRKVR